MKYTYAMPGHKAPSRSVYILCEPNSLTQVSLTNRIPGEKAFLNLTAASAATFKHGRIKRGVDRLAPGYTVPSYQKGYL